MKSPSRLLRAETKVITSRPASILREHGVPFLANDTNHPNEDKIASSLEVPSTTSPLAPCSKEFVDIIRSRNTCYRFILNICFDHKVCPCVHGYTPPGTTGQHAESGSLGARVLNLGVGSSSCETVEVTHRVVARISRRQLGLRGTERKKTPLGQGSARAFFTRKVES